MGESESGIDLHPRPKPNPGVCRLCGRIACMTVRGVGYCADHKREAMIAMRGGTNAKV